MLTLDSEISMARYCFKHIRQAECEHDKSLGKRSAGTSCRQSTHSLRGPPLAPVMHSADEEHPLLEDKQLMFSPPPPPSPRLLLLLPLLLAAASGYVLNSPFAAVFETSPVVDKLLLEPSPRGKVVKLLTRESWSAELVLF